MEKLLLHFCVALFLPHTKSEPDLQPPTTFLRYRIIAQHTEVKLHSAIATKQKSSS